ncbi:MAG TPA: PQQ-binding-like beta-propeller repeat protein [Candidatus Tumulicola sp.]
MRGIRQIATAITLLTFPALFATGCASGAAGTAFTPLSPASTASRWIDNRQVAVPDATKADWLQFGYDAGHSGFNPLEKTLNSSNLSKLAIAWNDKQIIQPNGIVAGDSVLYVDSMGQKNEGLYAFDSTTGKKKWSADVKLNGGWGSFQHAVSAIAGSMVVTPCSNGSTTKFLTGYCGVNASTGKIAWKAYCTEYQGNPCPGLANGVDTSPAYDNKLIFGQITQGVNEQPDTLAIDAQTGKTLWAVAGQYHCPDAGLTSENPLPVSSGVVFAVLGCGDAQGNTEICAFAESSGKTVWCDESPTPYIEEMVADASRLYVVEPGGGSTMVVQAFAVKSGASVWKSNIPAQGAAGLAVDTSRLYVEDGSVGVYALQAGNGKPVWSNTTNGNLYVGGAIAVANGLVYTNGGGGNNGNVAIAAFDSAKGKLVYSTPSISNGSSQASGVIVNGTIYTGCYTLCAFAIPAKKGAK